MVMETDCHYVMMLTLYQLMLEFLVMITILNLTSLDVKFLYALLDFSLELIEEAALLYEAFY